MAASKLTPFLLACSPQVNKLLSLAEYIETLKKKPKRTLKTERDRKKWLKETCPDLKFVKHPRTGKDAIPVEQDMLMLVGTKNSSTRSKDQRFETKEEAKDAAKKARVEVSTNKKARLISGGRALTSFAVTQTQTHCKSDSQTDRLDSILE